MAAGTVTITGTLVNPAGTALASQKVYAYRLQDKATASALSAASVGTATEFSASTNGSGVFSIACTHLTAHVAPLTYKIVFPDNRYCLQQVTVYDNGKTIELGTIIQYTTPVSRDGVNITSLAQRNQAQGNVTANNFIGKYSTTATAAGTTTLTVNSTYLQEFTGSTTQTVVLPVTSTLTLGHSFYIINNSSGTVTVNSSGGNLVGTLVAGNDRIFSCVGTGTTAASWSTTLAVGDALTSGTLAQFASTTSAQLATLLSDETGTDKAVFNTSPGFTTAINPLTNSAAALGTTSLGWSNLHLATGATVNVANGNAVITHSSGTLTVSTGDLRVTTAGADAASAVTVGGSQTLTGKTLTNNIVGDTVFCTTEFVAVTGTTGDTLTDVVGMGPLTVAAAGTYLIECDIPCLATANCGLKLAFKYTTATMTTFQSNAMQWVAAGALTQEAQTVTTDQPDITSQTAALTYVRITGKMVVNAGGTVKMQAAQNVAHADETKVLVGASMRLIRVA